MWFQKEKLKSPRHWLSAKGQSAVEFAIVVPVLALFLFVAADFGRIFFVSVAVNNAARAGAQFGSQSTATASATDEPTGMQIAACNDYGYTGLTATSFTGSTCQTVLNPTVSVCTCGTVSAGFPACSSSSASPYCSDTKSDSYVTVNTSATFQTILNYPGITNSYTLTGQATMQVQQ
jgi:Flp pilus assembly protein TadG